MNIKCSALQQLSGFLDANICTMKKHDSTKYIFQELSNI